MPIRPDRFTNSKTRALISAEEQVAEIIVRLAREMHQPVGAVRLTYYGDGQYSVEIVPVRRKT